MYILDLLLSDYNCSVVIYSCNGMFYNDHNGAILIDLYLQLYEQHCMAVEHYPPQSLSYATFDLFTLD